MAQPVFYGYDEETVADIDDGEIKIEWTNAREGRSGDYTPSDPDDFELLRFTVHRFDDGEWEEVEGASYCTNMPLHTDQDIIERSLVFLYEHFREAMDDPYVSVRKLGEELSWISPDEF